MSLLTVRSAEDRIYSSFCMGLQPMLYTAMSMYSTNMSAHAFTWIGRP